MNAQKDIQNAVVSSTAPLAVGLLELAISLTALFYRLTFKAAWWALKKLVGAFKKSISKTETPA